MNKPSNRPQTAKNLRVHDWDHWQSYRKDRGQPPWIKIHRCLMRDIKWISLSDSERGHLIAIWLLAADHDGEIPANGSIVQKLCYLDAEPNLNKFIELGLLDGVMPHVGVNVASTWRQRDALETETETETESSLSVSKKNRRNEYPSDFEKFWKGWKFHKTPAGVKSEAFAEWKRHIVPSGIDLETISARRDGYCAQCKQTDTNTKHVCRWIKSGGWKQEYSRPSLASKAGLM